MKNIYFTSDTHFGHANIIKYSKRPFKDINEMNEALIANWNAKVRSCDTVYHLGDFGFGTQEFINSTFRRLNGTKYFLFGNHDKKGSIKFHDDNFNKTRIQSIKYYDEIKVEEQNIVLFHYPMLTWNKARHGAWMLHGHCHHSVDYMNADTTRLDVGVDGPGYGYSPLSFDEVKAIMDKKQYKIVDHHGNVVDKQM